MKKLIILLVAALVVLAPGGWIFAAYNDFDADADVTINMSGLGIDLTLKSLANVEEMTVSEDSITLTLQPNSSVTIESADRKTLSASGFTTATLYCPSSGASKIIITSPSVAVTGTISPSGVTCDPPPSSGSGPSSSPSPSYTPSPTPSPTVTTPTDISIAISAGAAETSVSNVTLTLGATGVSEMMISNKSNFEGASWETYAISKAWVLSSGLGKKMVYAKFKSSSGGESSTINASVMLLPAPAVQAITASAGNKIGLSDNLVSVDMPAGTLSQNASVSISPTSVFTAPTGSSKVVGNRAYDFKAEVGGASVKNFNKDVTLEFKYTSEDLGALPESSLAIWYWDEAQNKWVKVGGTVNTVNKTVVAKVNHFTLFALFGETLSRGGDLVKLKCDKTNKDICTAVYYVGADGKRYVFPTEKTFYTWYSDFSGVKEISATELAAYRIGGNVTYKSGVKMIKITSDPKVYVVSKGGILKEIGSEAAAMALYGATWNKQIDDLPDSFFVNYKIGSKVSTASEFDKENEKAVSVDINTDKGL